MTFNTYTLETRHKGWIHLKIKLRSLFTHPHVDAKIRWSFVVHKPFLDLQRKTQLRMFWWNLTMPQHLKVIKKTTLFQPLTHELLKTYFRQRCMLTLLALQLQQRVQLFGLWAPSIVENIGSLVSASFIFWFRVVGRLTVYLIWRWSWSTLKTKSLKSINHFFIYHMRADFSRGGKMRPLPTLLISCKSLWRYHCSCLTLLDRGFL